MKYKIHIYGYRIGFENTNIVHQERPYKLRTTFYGKTVTRFRVGKNPLQREIRCRLNKYALKPIINKLSTFRSHYVTKSIGLRIAPLGTP